MVAKIKRGLPLVRTTVVYPKCYAYMQINSDLDEPQLERKDSANKWIQLRYDHKDFVLLNREVKATLTLRARARILAFTPHARRGLIAK